MWTPTTRKQFLAESGLAQETMMKLHLMASLHGGAQAKQAQITRVKNAAATLLLEQGYKIHQVSKLVDQLMRKTSAQYIDSVLQGSQTAKLQALRNACQENGIHFPTEDRTAQQVYAATQKHKATKMQQKQEESLDPMQFRVPENEDGTAAQAVATIRPHTTGYCLTTATQADTWIQGNKPVSPDERWSSDPSTAKRASRPSSSNSRHKITTNVTCYSQPHWCRWERNASKPISTRSR